HWFTGNPEAAVEPLEFALEIAESLFLPDVLSEALNTKNLLLIASGRRQESEALLRHSLRLAQEHGIQASAFRAQFNLAYHGAGGGWSLFSRPSRRRRSRTSPSTPAHAPGKRVRRAATPKRLPDRTRLWR